MPEDTSGSGVSGMAGLSETERVIDTFVAPSKTFTDILRSTSWWLPFLILVVVSLLSTVVIDKKVGFDLVVQNTMRDSPKQEERLAQLEPAQRAAQIHKMAIGYRVTSYIAPIFYLLVAVIAALGLWGSFNFGMGARTTFGQMFAIWLYASLPRLLAGLLLMITVGLGNSEGFNLKNPVGTNLGFYLPDSAPWLRAFLSYFDVIGIWVMYLLILGTAIVAKVTKTQAAIVIVGWWLFFMIVTVGMAAVFS